MNSRIGIVMVGATIGLAMGAGSVLAQQLPNARQAARQLYKTGRNATEIRFLRPDLIPPQIMPTLKKAPQVQTYYAAIAVSPDEGLMGKSAMQAVNFHDPESAAAAAIAGCNAKRAEKSKPCVVIADFVPKGYKPGASFSLSANATKVFKKKYRWAGRKKAFAVSHASGNWGMAVKAGTIEEARAAAIADCAAKAAKLGANDCAVVSEN